MRVLPKQHAFGRNSLCQVRCLRIKHGRGNGGWRVRCGIPALAQTVVALNVLRLGSVPPTVDCPASPVCQLSPQAQFVNLRLVGQPE